MGNHPSKTKTERKEQQQSDSSQGKTLNDTKQILLLHRSSGKQVKVVRNFRDALTIAANGGVRVSNVVNISEGKENLKDLPWLEKLNNVVLICLTPEAISYLEEVVRTKRFADENGILHDKVFSISFGASLASQWPPKGMRKGSSDARDFCFEFTNVEKLKPQDFERSEKMQSLITAIKGT